MLVGLMESERHCLITLYTPATVSATVAVPVTILLDVSIPVVIVLILVLSLTPCHLLFSFLVGLFVIVIRVEVVLECIFYPVTVLVLHFKVVIFEHCGSS